MAPKTKQNDFVTVEFDVFGITTGPSAGRLESQINELAGIERVLVDFTDKTAWISFDKKKVCEDDILGVASNLGVVLKKRGDR